MKRVRITVQSVTVSLTPLQVGALIDAVCAIDGFALDVIETWGEEWQAKRDAALKAIDVLHKTVALAMDAAARAARQRSRGRAKTRKSSLIGLRTYSGPVPEARTSRPTKASGAAPGRSTAKRARRSSKASGR